MSRHRAEAVLPARDRAGGPPRRSRATWLLLGLSLAGTGLATTAAVRSLLTVTGVLSVDPSLTTSARERAASQGATGLLGPLDAAALRTAEGISLLVSLPVAVVSLVLLLGLITWRAWALDSVLGVYGIVGALLVLFSAAGLANGAPNAAAGLLAGLAVLAVAALAVCPPVRADADRVRIAAEVRERARLKALRQRDAGSVQQGSVQQGSLQQGSGPRRAEQRGSR